MGGLIIEIKVLTFAHESWVTSNIQANQHLKNENVLWVKKAQYDKKGCGNTSEMRKKNYQVKRKKSRQFFFFWGGGGPGWVKEESNLGGIDFCWYLLVKTSFWAPKPPLPFPRSPFTFSKEKVYQYPVNQLPVSKHI